MPVTPLTLIATPLTGSLNVAVAVVPVGTPVAPAAGLRAVTVGAVVSVAAVSNTTSTQ